MFVFGFRWISYAFAHVSQDLRSIVAGSAIKTIFKLQVFDVVATPHPRYRDQTVPLAARQAWFGRNPDLV